MILLETLETAIGSSGYTAWVPVWANLTVGSGTSSGRYVKIGKMVTGYAKFVMGGTSSVTGTINCTPPVTAHGSWHPPYVGGTYIEDVGGQGYSGFTHLISGLLYPACQNTSSTYAVSVAVNATTPFTFAGANGDFWICTFTYEAA